MASFILLNGSAVILALLIARSLRLGGRASQLCLATLSGYLVIVHSLILAAGLLGMLTVAGVVVLLLVAVAGAMGLARGVATSAPAIAERARWTIATRLAALVAAALGVAWMWPHLFAATRV